ncbi:MAG: tyrosine phosphatase family protein [Geminicoccaceae bacterium]
MARVHVTNLATLADEVARVRPQKVVTVIDPGTALPDLPELATEAHLRLFFHDLSAPRTAADILPSRSDMQTILTFADALGPDGILVHCFAGVSRSTATAYAIACMYNPGREQELAQMLRQRGPHAIPNRLMVAFADDLLGRGGRMNEAIAALPPPHRPMFERRFELPLVWELDAAPGDPV